MSCSPLTSLFFCRPGDKPYSNKHTGTDSQVWWKPGLVRNGGRSRVLNSQDYMMTKISARDDQAVAEEIL
jgi:hypothetical protein